MAKLSAHGRKEVARISYNITPDLHVVKVAMTDRTVLCKIGATGGWKVAPKSSAMVANRGVEAWLAEVLVDYPSAVVSRK